MEYTIEAFVDRLKELFTDSSIFPYMEQDYYNNGYTQSDSSKHPHRSPQHLKDAVKECFENSMSKQTDMITFEMGSEKMEKMHPYYHILEDAPVIRKKYRGTEKSKGSQASIEDVGKRDYGIVNWNGKTFTKEYSKNVRGSRKSVVEKAQLRTKLADRAYITKNFRANSYVNTHYKYIEKILDSGILETLAKEFNMTLKRKIDTGLAEEYFSQFDEAPINILDILGSFN